MHDRSIEIETSVDAFEPENETRTAVTVDFAFETDIDNGGSVRQNDFRRCVGR